MAFEYSVVIRTLGTGKEKYQALLNSIDSQTIKPKHVYVFIADGYELPAERLGYEEFIRCEKGMWKQRVFGMEYTANKGDSEYQLVLDDDLSFAPDFVEKSYKIIQEYNADILINGIGHNGQKPYSQPSTFKKKLSGILLGNRYEIKHSEWQIKIAPTAGFIVNVDNQDNVRKTQSGPFVVFFIRSNFIPQLSLAEESWIDETKYALPDDQVFFYKAYCLGAAMFNCKEPFVNHLDHGSSSASRKNDAALASGRNYLIFWHRFLYKRNHGVKRIMLCLAIGYRLTAFFLYNLVASIVSRDFSSLKSFAKGVKMGLSYIRSQGYYDLPSINK